MSKKWIYRPHVEGKASRQAHADLPKGTYEREISKEGFFGPAAHMYHPTPPTGWTSWEGPLRPRAFDLAKLDGKAPSPQLASEATVHGYTVAFWVAAGVFAFGAVLIGAMMRNVRLDPQTAAEPELIAA